MAPRYELAVGLRKGHHTTKIRAVKPTLENKKKKIKPSHLKGVCFTLYKMYYDSIFYFYLMTIILHCSIKLNMLNSSEN